VIVTTGTEAGRGLSKVLQHKHPEGARSTPCIAILPFYYAEQLLNADVLQLTDFAS